jgi:predicted amidohydrolase
MKDLARQRQILLIPGTFPTPFEGRPSAIGNRAHIFFPDGRVLTQNKLCLTPREKSPSGWMMSAGDELAIFEWRGFKVAVMVCLDIELPALSAKIAQEKIDLILVPSMTKKLAGYHRVFDCAKARAIELQAAIAVTGAIGGGPGREPNIAGASIFLPCEEKLGHTGLLAQITPSYTAEGEGPLLTAEIPLSDIRTLRQGQAEVWPGAWAADHVKICRSA